MSRRRKLNLRCIVMSRGESWFVGGSGAL